MLLGSPPDMIHSAPSHRTHAPYGQIKAHSAFTANPVEFAYNIILDGPLKINQLLLY